MTVSSTTARNEYNGNGATTVFAYTFRILDEDHIAVYVGGTLKTITTDYTVSGVGVSGGGNITFVAAPASGTANVIFLRNVPLTQETDYVENDPFPAESHEDALDKLTMIVQQQQEKIDRTLQLPVTGTFNNVSVPDPSAGKALLWNQTEDALINSTDNFNDIVTNAAASASTATTQAGIATTEAGLAETARLAAEAAQTAAEAAAATIPTYPSLTGAANKYIRVAAGETAVEYRTAAETRADLDLEVGVDVQAYDADTAKLDVDQSWTGSQRGAVTTDNDASLDLNAANNFSVTLSGSATLTFTNIASAGGQSGFIKLVNGSNYTVSAHANTKINTADLTAISASGTYLLSYFCDSTDVWVVASKGLTA